ncbi:hypothetical protein B4102_2147 [Heyndrickxia sporothermodurans]|uniref:Uncharacterized protein n=1 Tax=Heyndrickxia sporothermodurans TaxID=46224 RepID=A0A150LHD2_9BACI|nr:hypothetical protein [Heyndrickxia sporothermodurans]KYD11419.1 hypothetical protein B4102_2147 [Heyndrickxia sporothermodurans]
MAQNTQSKIISIDEQIQKLKEKRNREIAKLERNTGKKLIERFKLENKSIDEIYSFINTLEYPNESNNVHDEE